LRSILPPNLGGGGGSCAPLIVVVALGDPGTPVICWAIAATVKSTAPTLAARVDAANLRFICGSLRIGASVAPNVRGLLGGPIVRSVPVASLIWINRRKALARFTILQ